MSAARRPTRRYVLQMVTAVGERVELTGDLPWGEARGMLAQLRRLFSDRDARAQGWTVAPSPRGFAASRGGTSVTFGIAEMPAVDLVGHGAALAAGGRHPGSPPTPLAGS